MKTYKREMAAFLTLVLIAAFIAGYWMPYFYQVATYVMVPIMLFVSGAFGLDAIAKQIKPQ